MATHALQEALGHVKGVGMEELAHADNGLQLVWHDVHLQAGSGGHPLSGTVSIHLSCRVSTPPDFFVQALYEGGGGGGNLDTLPQDHLDGCKHERQWTFSKIPGM